MSQSYNITIYLGNCLMLLIILWDRWNIKMPTIMSGSISILSDAGLGMAMFSLGIVPFIYIFSYSLWCFFFC